MGNFIIKLDDHYLEWSSVTKAPASCGMPFVAFRKFYADKYETRMLIDLDRRMVRVVAKGTSAFDYKSVDDVIRGNRAGADETELSREQLVDFFVRRRCQGPRPKGR